MAAHLVEVPPPRAGIYRLARGPADPFALPDWDRVGQDGTFGNRFDDPAELAGVGTDERFRTLYCATRRITAFGETLARFRPDPTLIAKLALVDDDEPIEAALSGAVDPEFPRHGLIPNDWIGRRRIGHALIDPDNRFVDLGAAESLAHLNTELRSWLRLWGLKEVDLSTVTSQHRVLTQFAARHIYTLEYAGIRYVSRLDSSWECWALFEGRFNYQPGSPGFSPSLTPDDPDLAAIARIFALTIEFMPGGGSYLRPWM